MTAILWQRIEGAGIALVILTMTLQTAAPDWSLMLWITVLLAPDLSMLGYLGGPRVGAIVYNLAHIYATPLAVMALSLVVVAPGVTLCAALWIAHIGIDRALGYGLKLPSDFRDTHLGRIGR